MPNVYVPTYTEHAGEFDMGYYDNQGVFHQNPNAKEPVVPSEAHTRDTLASDGVPLSNSLSETQRLDEGLSTSSDDRRHTHTNLQPGNRP